MSLRDLKSRLEAATGADRQLDRFIATALAAPERPYTSSIEDCEALIQDRLPGAEWHVGWAANGIAVYATLDHHGHREESTGGSVPLVLLSVLVRQLRRQ